MAKRAVTVAYENRRKKSKNPAPVPADECCCSAYGSSVKAHLAKMGSPDPAHDLKHSDHYIQRCQAGGVDASVCAAVIYAAVHHSHPPSSHMQETATSEEFLAVDPTNRVIGGPYALYWQAKQEADKSHGYVKYVGEEAPRRSYLDKPKVGDVVIGHGLTWKIIYITAGGEYVIQVKSKDMDYTTTISSKEWKQGIEPHMVEANDSSTVCKPFTRLERDPARFDGCMLRAKQIGPIINSKKIFELVRGDVEKLDEEHFFVLCFDFRGQLRDYVEVAIGQRHRVTAEIEDILAPIIISKADAVCLVHNHPSGDPAPSEMDEKLTRDVFEGMKKSCPGIMLADHIIVGSGGRYTSFFDKGILPT